MVGIVSHPVAQVIPCGAFAPVRRPVLSRRRSTLSHRNVSRFEEGFVRCFDELIFSNLVMS